MPIGVKTGKSINFSEPIPTRKIINVPHIEQEQTNWCWAACIEMVLRYYDTSVAQQCELANELFVGVPDCCSEPSSPECNKPCEIEEISTLYLHRNIQSQLVDENVSFSTLQSEIDADRPVEILFQYKQKEKRGHLVIVRGWYTIETEEYVHVNDPKDDDADLPRMVAYSELLNAYGEGKWTSTWIKIQRKKNDSRWKVTR